MCVRTGDAGLDARGLYSTDDLLPDIFCRPYLELEPRWAHVVESGDGIVGYLVATAHTGEFVRRYRADWLPGFARRYPVPNDSGPAGDESVGDLVRAQASPADVRERALIRLGHRPERMLIAEVEAFPAHLHIDLLPAAQGQGLGRRLIAGLSAALGKRGVPGLHLTMDPANAGAREFYRRLGFTELPSSTANAPVLGLDLRR